LGRKANHWFLYTVHRSRKRGALTPYPLYAFMALWLWTSLLITNSMEKGHFWEASSRSACHWILCLPRNLKVHYHVNNISLKNENCPPPDALFFKI